MRVGAAIDDESLNLDGDGALVSGGFEAGGDFFQRLRRETVSLGGSLEACPFGETYTGPVIRWSGWYPYMSEFSEVQKELFNEGSI